MTYKETLDYLYSRLPMFSKLGASAIKKDLTNTLELCKHLDNPQLQIRTIHIAGTNGKGSVSHMLAAILQTAGYKTGLYTSPHLLDFRERIRINGKMIPEQQVIGFTKSQKQIIEEIEPSFFEVTVAMAFDYFQKENVDIAIIETGLGGRLDSTNVITPLLSVITNIGYDHTNILGTTLPQIASEKAGIIKPSVPVVIGEKHPETGVIFIKKATECSSEIVFASDEWDIEVLEKEAVQSTDTTLTIHAHNKHRNSTISLVMDLTGTYQLKNIKTVLAAVEQLNKLGLNITNEHLQAGVKQVKSLTGLMGRWQVLSTSPFIVCDTGHNEHGIKEIVKNIRNARYQQLHMVIGMVKDKDISKVLSLLPTDAIYYFCSPAIERGKDAGELHEEAKDFGLVGNSYPSVIDALNAAKLLAKKNDMIFIGGSTFVVAEVL